MSHVPEANDMFVYPKDGQKIQVHGKDFFAMKDSAVSCDSCVANDNDSLCTDIHDHIDMCGTCIWLTEIDYLKRKMRDD